MLKVESSKPRAFSCTQLQLINKGVFIALIAKICSSYTFKIYRLFFLSELKSIDDLTKWFSPCLSISTVGKLTKDYFPQWEVHVSWRVLQDPDKDMMLFLVPQLVSIM